jgi:hypothetical protein
LYGVADRRNIWNMLYGIATYNSAQQKGKIREIYLLQTYFISSSEDRRSSLVYKLPAPDETQRFITMFTTACPLSNPEPNASSPGPSILIPY